MLTALSDKQERFVHEYLIDMNAAAAARRAGYSAGTRGNTAAALMRNPLVSERIGALLAELLGELKIRARDMMRQRARIAFFRPDRMFDAAGEPLPLHGLDEDTAAVLTVHHDVRANGNHVMRVRQPDRQKALAVLEKAHLRAMTHTQAEILAIEEARELAGAMEEVRRRTGQGDVSPREAKAPGAPSGAEPREACAARAGVAPTGGRVVPIGVGKARGRVLLPMLRAPAPAPMRQAPLARVLAGVFAPPAPAWPLAA